MKLCFVADANHANAANWLEYFATELGHDVHVISLTRVRRPIRGVKLYDLSTRNKLLLLARIPLLQKLFTEINPDLVVAYRVQSYSFLAACTGFHPLVMVAQSRTVVWPPNSKVMEWFCKYAIRRGDWFFSWADHTTERLVELGADRDFIDTFPRGVRPELFFPQCDTVNTNAKTIITTRSLVPDYKHEELICAIRDLAKLLPEVKYQIAGEGKNRVSLERLVEQLSLESNVEFLGYVPTVNLPDTLRAADVYVSAYLEDGVSMSLLEAMACGVFPIVPDIEPNHRWIQHGVNGLLFRPGDRPSLVEKLYEALTNPALREKARDHNVRFVQEELNWHTNMRRIESRFSQLVSQYKCPDPLNQRYPITSSPYCPGTQK